MAEVYLAEQCRLKRRVAVKILKPALAEDQIYLKRFEREAQAAASLVHANIVQIHEVGHADGLHYIVQEYVAGLNLRQWIARYGPADLGRALSIMRQTAAGLAKAADAGVVHRDIKPENIMLTPDGRSESGRFRPGPPGRRHPSHRADPGRHDDGHAPVHEPGAGRGQAAGLPQRPLFLRRDLLPHAHAATRRSWPRRPWAWPCSTSSGSRQPLESLRPDLPPALCRIVHKMLIKDPAGRWQSPRELLRELRRVQQEYCAAGSSGGGEESGVWESSAALPADPRLEASRQLAARHEKLPPRPNGAAAAVAAGAGAWWPCSPPAATSAWFTLRQEPLLAVSRTGHVRLQQQATAVAQFYCASQIGTEEAWRSVLEYFPEKESVVRRAKQQLARIYFFREGDYDRALAIFDEFAASTDADKEYRAWGLAGKVGVLTLPAEVPASRPRCSTTSGPSAASSATSRCRKCSAMPSGRSTATSAPGPQAVRTLAEKRVPRQAVGGTWVGIRGISADPSLSPLGRKRG